MTFSGDIRSYFESEAAAFPAPAGLRASVVHEAEREAPQVRPGTRMAAFVAGFVAVALAAGLVALGTYVHNQSRVGPMVVPTPSSTPITKPPVPPAGAHPAVEVDFLNASTGFALLCTYPNGGQCQYWVTTTTDAGSTWSKPVKVGQQVTTGDSGHHIHFANAKDGIMYGNSSAFVTHDGARTWKALNMKFLEIVSVSGSSPLWMVLYPCNKGVVCPYQVFKSNDGARTWAQAAALPVPQAFSPDSVVAFGNNGLLMSGFGSGDMLITRDGGVTWTPIPGQCRPDTLGNLVGTADGAEIWQMCTPLPPDPAVSTLPWTNTVAYTQDGGAHWISRDAPAGNFQAIAVFGFGRVIEATNTAGLRVTHDGGHTWTQVANNPEQPGVVALSWLDDGEAWAVDVTGAIWTTTDFGTTWSALPAQP